jgi:GYF domain 2
MYKIIGADQKEYGPVTADQINAWILEGRANGQTLVQVVGSADWRPLSSIPELAAVLAAKLPSPPLESSDPEVTANTVLARGIEVNVGECLGRGWRLLTNNLGLFLTTSLVFVLIRFALGWVPVIGGLAYFVMYGALWGGFYLIVLKRLRGEPAAIGDLFAGFNQNFVQFMLVGIVTYFLTTIGTVCCLVVPGIYLAVAWQFSLVLVADRRLEFWPAMELSRRVITRYWFQVFGLIVTAYLPLILFASYSIFRVFSVMYPVVISNGGRLDFREIMKMMGGFFTLSLVQQLIGLFTLPFAAAALMCAYEDIFCTRPTKAP